MAVQANDHPPPSSLSFSQGFLLGQLSIALLIFCFIKFFIFGEPPPADERAIHLSSLRRQRTLAHQRSQSNSLRRKASTILRNPPGPLSTASILAKTYYNIHGHQPESLDWFNVLIAQTIAQLRADARHDDAILKSLTKVINGPNKPDFVGEIRVTEIALGDEFPIFSNCRVIPVEEGGLFDGAGAEGGRLQARMDVDLSDVLTLGIETTLVLNYPKPRVAVLPVALAVSVVRFSGTLAISFLPSTPPSPTTSNAEEQPNSSANPSYQPTTLAFTFLDDYRLDLSIRSLVGSRSRLQDVPKIAQLIEARLHSWFDDRVVEPRFQQIVLPNFWPRKKNTRGGEEDDDESSRGTGGDEPSPRKRSSSMAVHSPQPIRAVPLVSSSSSKTAFEAHMEAEGAKLREQEERMGLRPQQPNQNNALHASRERANERDLRYRRHQKHRYNDSGDASSDDDWHTKNGIIGSMPGSLIS